MSPEAPSRQPNPRYTEALRPEWEADGREWFELFEIDIKHWSQQVTMVLPDGSEHTGGLGEYLSRCAPQIDGMCETDEGFEAAKALVNFALAQSLAVNAGNQTS